MKLSFHFPVFHADLSVAIIKSLYATFWHVCKSTVVQQLCLLFARAFARYFCPFLPHAAGNPHGTYEQNSVEMIFYGESPSPMDDVPRRTSRQFNQMPTRLDICAFKCDSFFTCFFLYKSLFS